MKPKKAPRRKPAAPAAAEEKITLNGVDAVQDESDFNTTEGEVRRAENALFASLTFLTTRLVPHLKRKKVRL